MTTNFAQKKQITKTLLSYDLLSLLELGLIGIKVIIHKLRSEASLVEQDCTIENVSVVYLKFIIIFF